LSLQLADRKASPLRSVFKGTLSGFVDVDGLLKQITINNVYKIKNLVRHLFSMDLVTASGSVIITALNRLTISVNGENVLIANREKDKLHFSFVIHLHPSIIPSKNSFMSSDLTEVSKNNEIMFNKK
jgi:hypothetical protein